MEETTIVIMVDTIIEEEGHCDPVWIVGFPFIDDQDAMEGKLAKILQAHEKELRSVFDAIKDKEDDYREE